jgi:tetratricopeptide (TPR) repeat protein
MSLEADIAQKLTMANDLPEGMAKIEQLNAAIQQAQHYQFTKLAYIGQCLYTQASIEGGYRAGTILYFPQLMAYAHAHPQDDAVDWHEMLWMLDWAVLTMVESPRVPLADALSALDQFLTLMKQLQVNRPRRLKEELLVRIYLGQEAEAAAIYEILATKYPRQKLGSGLYTLGYYLEKNHRWTEAREMLTPYLERETHDPELEEMTATLLMMPMLFEGQTEKAEAAYRFAKKQIQPSLSEMATCGDLLAFESITQKYAKAIALFERTEPFSHINEVDISLAVWLRGVYHFLRRIGEKGKPLQLRLSPKHPCFRPDGQYDRQELANYYHQRRYDFFRAFDQRNQRPFWQKYHSRWDEECDRIDPPIDPS